MNPNLPPGAPLNPEPMSRPQRPLVLNVGIGVLAFEMIGSLLLTLFHVWYLKQINPTENHSSALIGALGLPLLEAPLLWLLARGLNWARYVTALLVALGLYAYVSSLTLSQVSNALAFELARDWGSYGLMVLGAALLFTPKVSEWFRQIRALQ